jgi:transcriptional regulator with GAF, ATPase, and Fis domain
VLAALAARDNDHNGAARLFDESISSLQTCGCVREQAMALLAAGRALLAEPKWRRLAARYLQAAARLAEQLQMVALGAGCYFELSRLEVEADNFDEAVTHLRSCESEALRVGNDALIEKCRVLRLNIEERLIDSGLSSANQFALFSSVLDSKEYGNLKSGDLVESLKILQSKIKADRAFVLTLDPDSRSYELLAELSFEGNALGKIASSLGNGRGGSIPLDRPLFVSRLDGDRQQMFDYLGNSKVQIGTLITIPIQLTDETQGILYLDRLGDEAPPFSKSDLYFAIAFADIIAFKSAEEQKRKLSRDNRRLLSQLQEQLAFPNFITASPQIMEVLERVAQVKDSPISILIEGATGTGKDHLAKAIHYNSNRRDRRFISVNCAALPETLFESELFGHKRGAFTGAESDKIGLFEEANGGTFFLDEIGDMPLSVQVKLLRVIEEKEVVRLGETTPRQVDVRVLSATNRDLKEFMEVGKFRQDLYYRLSTFAFRLPPLRERREDIPLLIKHFMGKLAEEVVIEPEAFG